MFGVARRGLMARSGRGFAKFMIATGGTMTTDGNYHVHTFTGSGTFTVTSLGDSGLAADNQVEYLVIAGGGGGKGWVRGSGGGAGGYRNSYGSETSGGSSASESALTVTATAYTITVGAGGTWQTYSSPSTFSSITCTGGGKGFSNTSDPSSFEFF